MTSREKHEGHKVREVTTEESAALDNWFTYHAPKPDQVQRYQTVRDAARCFGQTIMDNCEPSADRTSALRNLRETVMQVNQAIACEPDD